MNEPLLNGDHAPLPQRGTLGEIARCMLKLGILGFGGPAAHIALMERELVRKRQWLSHQYFLDLIGATNLIPGPNSTEMAIHLGYVRGGWRGLVVGGACFIMPAFILTLVLSWAYVRYGELPAVEPWLAGIKPVILAIIAAALWQLARKAVKSWTLGVLAALTAAAAFAGVSEIAVLLVGGVAGALLLGWLRRGTDGAAARSAPDAADAHAAEPAPGAVKLIVAIAMTLAAVGVLVALSMSFAGAYPPEHSAAVPLWHIGVFFLKVGSVLYGSGYVLIAFLEDEVVRAYGWLTQAELLDAVAIGQLTPGPVLTTSTSIGYFIGSGEGGAATAASAAGGADVGRGLAAAAVATVCIFAPAFVFVALLSRIMPLLRRSFWAGCFLDAVNAAAVALMVVVTVQLGEAALLTWQSWLIALVTLVLLITTRINSAWLILGGAIVGRVLLLPG